MFSIRPPLNSALVQPDIASEGAPVSLTVHKKKIVIAGAGAVGSYYGGMLARGGHDVHFLARGDHLWAMRKNGLKIQDTFRGLDLTMPVNAREGSSLHWDWEPADLVLLASKTYDTNNLLDQVTPLIGPSTLLLSLQNGMESESIMGSRFGEHCVLGGLCYISAQMPSPGVILQGIQGKLLFGEMTGAQTNRVMALSVLFSRAGIVNEASSTIRQDKWEKFAWNVPFNQLAAVGDLNVGQLLDDPMFVDGIRAVMNEVIKIATVHGVNLGDGIFDRHMTLSQRNRPLVPSLLQDARKGKSMEHDAFSGFIVREGKKYRISTPYNSRLSRFLSRPAVCMNRSPAFLRQVLKSAKIF